MRGLIDREWTPMSDAGPSDGAPSVGLDGDGEIMKEQVHRILARSATVVVGQLVAGIDAPAQGAESQGGQARDKDGGQDQ